MSYRLAYIYDTEAEAIAARNIIDAAMHLPISGGITQHWTDYVQHGDRWAIIYTPELGPILGQPQVLFELPPTDPIDP